MIIDLSPQYFSAGSELNSVRKIYYAILYHIVSQLAAQQQKIIEILSYLTQHPPTVSALPTAPSTATATAILWLF